MTRPQLILAIGTLFVFALAGWLFFPRTTVSPAPSGVATSSDVETAAPNPPSRPVSYLFPIAKGDAIASWNFDGYLNDNGPLEAEARQKIKTLIGQLGKDNDYQLYISLAQEYDHLGEGKPAYEYLSRAIALDTGETTGVGWHNMGVLMEKVGAYRTARIAHERAVKIQPNISSFQISRVELMIYHFPKDTAGVEKAFTDAEAIFGGDNPMLIDLRKRWKNLL